MHSPLESNLRRLRQRIAQAALRDGREAGDVALLAVTKSVPPKVAAEAFDLGLSDLGESRCDGLERKSEYFEQQGLVARWHFIGHLQRNKARRVVACAAVIHSVDSTALMETVDQAARDLEKRVEIYLQVKLSPEPMKSGVAPEDLPALIEAALSKKHLVLAGLMTMAPLSQPLDRDIHGDGLEMERTRAARGVFARLAGLAHEIETRPTLASAFADRRVRLSMGMSDDFEAAIQEGSHVVRVGRLLFERDRSEPTAEQASPDSAGEPGPRAIEKPTARGAEGNRA